MKLTKEIKEKIDAYFDSKTPEELEYITSKYIAGCDPYKKDSPVVVYEQMDKAYMQPYDKIGVLYELYKWKFPWLKKTNGKEGMDFRYIDRFKIPFDFDLLQEGDRIENKSGEELIYREEERFYNFINNDVDKFLSDTMIYQEWKRI